MHSTYNSYIFQTNVKVIFIIFIVHRFLWAINLSIINAIIESRVVLLLEILAVGRCSYNLWFCTKHITTPYIMSCRRAWWDYVFVLGPISKAITTFLMTYCLPAAPATVIVPEEPTTEKRVSLIESLDKAQAMFPPATYKPTQYSVTIGQSPIHIAAKAEKKKQNDQAEKDRRMVEHLLFGLPEPKKDEEESAEPVFRFVPAKPMPLKPLEKRDRNLWHLARTKKLIADFKREQLEGYHEEWNKFNDERTREHYHRLSEAMLKNIFKPLCTAIKSFETVLSNSQQNIATCNPEFIALTVVLPEFSEQKYFPFNLSEINRFITVNSRGDVDVKAYVLERLKDLGNSKRMAAFRGIPTIEGMPADAQIIYHVVRNYLKMREPHIVPPLLPLEGDIFKFILIYVKMTPELGWNVF